MNITEFLLSISKQSSKVMDIIHKILLILAISSIVLSCASSDYKNSIHNLLNHIHISNFKITLTISEWNLIIQWVSISYLFSSAYFIFDYWLIPCDSHVKKLWEIFSDLLLIITLLGIITRNTHLLSLLKENINWVTLPLTIIFIYAFNKFLSTYIRIIYYKRSKK